VILIFDLDDTLYDERQFVEGGLRAVAAWGEAAHGIAAGPSFEFMREVLDREGRGRIFDLWLSRHGRLSAAAVKHCVGVYRHHSPDLRLFAEAERVLDRYQGKVPLYLVTDGHKEVQANKVRALGLEARFRRVFITHRFGVRHAKPSPYCFDLIRRAESCAFSDLVYIGDNPAKDFVGLNPLGALTVRVLTGVHKDAPARPGFEARHSIDTLDALPELLQTVNSRLISPV
jgi:putative hydrolase of the HAD superfamily